MGVIAKYKFNNTLEANLLPEFNSEFTSDLYTVTDEVDGEVTTRTIESESLPTLMRFGYRATADSAESPHGTQAEAESLLDVLEMSIDGLTTMSDMFRLCENVISIVLNGVGNGINSMRSMCENCLSLTTLITNNLDTSNVTKMQFAFSQCNKLTSLDVSNFNTSNVTSMHSMFSNCNKLTSLDVSNFNTSNVTSMQNMFYNCTNLNTLDVSNFNTSNVTTMQSMFSGCNKLTSLDVSNFNTSNVTSMRSMFNSCNNLTSLDVSNFDTSNVTDIRGMFHTCNNLTSLDVSNFNTSNVTNMRSVFYTCTKLTSLDVSNFNTSNVTDMNSMFAYCNNLTSLDVSNFDTSNVTDMGNMFYSTNNLKYLKCNNVNTLNTLNTYLPTKTSDNQGTIICKTDTTNLDVTTLQSKYWNILDELTLITKYVFDKSIHNNCIPEFNTEFEGYFIEDEVVEGSNEVIRTIESCGMLPTLMRFGSTLGTYVEGNELALLEVLDMNTSGLTSCYRMFRYCTNLTSITCEWDTSRVTTMEGMFQYCTLTSLDVSNFDTSNVTTMRSMFFNCNNLTSLDVSNFNTSNVTTMRSMFQYCTNLTSLDLSNFDTSNVTTMHDMFSWCYNLTTLDLSNFNTSNVTDMTQMFYNCTKLTSLDVSNFDTSNVTNTTNMFNNTPLLADIGVLYMDKSSLQKLVNAMPTDSNKTLWYKDVDIDGITHGDNITLKKYMEENVEIVLNSPLLEGDTIEVVDGKLCHVSRHYLIKNLHELSITTHLGGVSPSNTMLFRLYLQRTNTLPTGVQFSVFSDKFKEISNIWNKDEEGVAFDDLNNQIIDFRIDKSKLSTQDISGFKQWLSENPTIVVYELTEPYYEDIIPLQSSLTLRTFEECNIQIITALPIKTKITYRTNITSAVVMEQELDTLDSGVSLSNLIEEEVDE